MSQTMMIAESRDEVLQPSSLRGYSWPKSDPREVDQPTRPRTEGDLETIRECASAANLDWTQFAKNTKALTAAEKAHYLLTHQRFQFNPVGKVRQEPRWLENIHRA